MLRRLSDYIRRSQQMDILLFKILGLGGIGVSIISAFYCVVMGDFVSAIINVSAAILSVILLYFVERTGKYTVGYVITEVAVFMGLFTGLYLTGGGLESSLPFFFAFALIFTFLMFQGKMLVIMEVILSVYYFAVCTFSYLHPEMINSNTSSRYLLSEKLIGIYVSALPMGLIILQYINAYKKQKKIAEDANAAKSMFLANMSHEIRTPINAILGFNEVIIKTSEDKQTREYAEYVQQAGHLLLEVVNKILHFSKLESGKEILNLQVFSFRELMEEIRNFMSISARQKNLDMELECEEGISEWVSGDREKIQRVLMNLLSNAFKYTMQGSVRLRVSVQERAEGRQKLCFEVMDTGLGISEENKENLFKAYERVDLLKNQKIQGTGLGLAISAQLVELMGGNLEVESSYGVGSRFFFSIILSEARQQECQAPKAERDTFTAPEARILVVDDDAMNRMLMDTYLKTLEIYADFAANGEECLEIVAENEYDLILMDYMMPVMDGLMAMQKIREQESKRGVHTPILVLTADVVDQNDRKLTRAGFDAFLSKPVDFRILEKELESYLPKEKIQRKIEDNRKLLSEEERRSYEAMLLPAGIDLEEGLRLVNGDFDQYIRFVGHFLDHSSQMESRMEEAMEKQDFDQMRMAFHSLKGNAGSVGAMGLYDLARRMEHKSRDEDREYVDCAYELLLLQWRRCRRSLQEFHDLVQVTGHEEEESKDAYDFEDLLEELIRELDFCQTKGARKLLDKMKKRCSNEEILAMLDQMETLVNGMEFETALELAEKLRK